MRLAIQIIFFTILIAVGVMYNSERTERWSDKVTGEAVIEEPSLQGKSPMVTFATAGVVHYISVHTPMERQIDRTWQDKARAILDAVIYAITGDPLYRERN